MTLKEIANKCQVSVATVSRVINNKGNVSYNTQEKILHFLNENEKNYKYFSSNEKNDTIAIIIPNIHNSFYSEIVKGITYTANKYNFDILLYDTNDELKKELKYLKKAVEQKVNGIIFMSSSKGDENDELKKLFLQIKIPIILMDKEIKNLQFDGIFLDDISGTFLLTKTLIENGHKNIGILVGENDSEVTKKRLKGYKEGLLEYEIPYNQENIFYSSFTKEHLAYNILDNVLKNENRPTAIISCSGLLTIALVKSIKDADLKIGKDLAIVSFDDVKILQLLGMNITSASTDLQEMGKAGFDLLYKKIKNETLFSSKLKIIPNIIKRGSEKSIS